MPTNSPQTFERVQYVVDPSGQRVAVVLTVADYEQFVKDFYVGTESPDLHDVRDIPWENLREGMLGEGMRDITDSAGNKVGLYFPLQVFEGLVEDLDDGRVVREREDGPRRPFSEFVEELRAAGEIDV